MDAWPLSSGLNIEFGGGAHRPSCLGKQQFRMDDLSPARPAGGEDGRSIPKRPYRKGTIVQFLLTMSSPNFLWPGSPR